MDAMEPGYGRERVQRERDSWEEPPRERDLQRRPRGGGDPLDQRVDRWMSAGRQFVEGVAGARPGSRPAPRAGERRGQRGPRFDELGRWVEDRLDWLLDDGDDWREPWQEAEPAAPPVEPPPPAPPRRRGLEAVSRRGRPAAAASVPPAAADDWPEDDSFSVPRWQRPAAPAAAEPAAPPAAPGRPLPRSSRRRT